MLNEDPCWFFFNILFKTVRMEGDQPKKKRVRKKPGRYKLQNRRVAQREAMARKRENQEGSEEENSPEVEQLRERQTFVLSNPSKRI